MHRRWWARLSRYFILWEVFHPLQSECDSIIHLPLLRVELLMKEGSLCSSCKSYLLKSWYVSPNDKSRGYIFHPVSPEPWNEFEGQSYYSISEGGMWLKIQSAGSIIPLHSHLPLLHLIFNLLIHSPEVNLIFSPLFEMKTWEKVG